MNLPPGPRNIVQLLKMLSERKKNPIRLYEDIFKTYGDIVYFQLGPYKFAMLNDVNAIEQVLQTDSKIYTKSTGYKRFALIVGNGLLVSEGDLWKRQRRLMSWAFSSKHIEKIHPVMVNETLNMIRSWRAGEQRDLAEEMNRVTLQVISVSLFGKSQLKESRDIRQSLQQMLSYLQTTRHLWIQLLLSPIPFINKRAAALKIETSMPDERAKGFFGAIRSVNKLVHGMIEERKQKGLQENFLDAMIAASDSEDQTKMSDTQLRDEAVNMLIAGHETTANALTWTWHQLLKYPDVRAKVKEEIQAVVTGKAPSYEEISKLTYTKAVFEESMRLYPPFWRISRMNVQETAIGGFTIPAGTNVIASIYTIHRSEKHWPDALTFRPERFLLPLKERHRFAFLPFGGGPRICIGMQFATIEALTILATCIKSCEFEKAFQQDPTYFMSLTLQPAEGCEVVIKKVEEV